LISLVSLVFLHTGAGVDASEIESGAALTDAA
jgi:hypothetical protein